MRRCNQIVGILLLILSIWVIKGSKELVYRVEFSPGAGFFPLWLGICLAVLSLILLLKNTIFKLSGKEGNPLPGQKQLMRILLILGSLLISILVFEHVGFLISMFLFVGFMLIFLEKYRWYTGILLSGSMVFAVYSIFKIWLGTPLPPGILK